MADDDLTKNDDELHRLLGQYGEGRPERRRVEAELKRRNAKHHLAAHIPGMRTGHR